MFERRHHQLIHQVMLNFNAPLLKHAKCYFGGGTAISMMLGEYRESVGIEFLFASSDGHALLRHSVQQYGTLGFLLQTPMTY